MSATQSYEEARPFGILWLIAFATALVGVLAYASAFHGPWRVPMAAFCLLAGYAAVTLVHQGGHLLAALLCRWRIVLVVIRRIGLQVPKRSLLFMPSVYDNGAGGWIEAVPRNAGAGTKSAWAIIIVAGPLATFLFAAYAVLGSVSLVPAPRDGSVNLANLHVGLAIQALSAGLRSLLSGQGHYQSDGQGLGRLIRIKKFGTNAPAYWIGILLRNRVRLRDIPDWMIEEARVSAAQDEGIARYLAGVEVGRFLDNPPFDPAAARAVIEDFRTRYGTDSWLASCDAYVAAIWEDDLPRAEAALGEVQHPSTVPAMTLAAEASLAAALGDAGTVQAKLAEIHRVLRAQSPFRDDTFREIQTWIEARLARTLASPARP